MLPAKAGTPYPAPSFACEMAGLKPSHLGRLGGFGAFAGNWRRRNGGDLVRVDFALAHEGHALLDHQLRCFDIAEHFRLGLDLNLLPGADIAVDFSAQDDAVDVDVALAHRVVAQAGGAIGIECTCKF